MTIENPEMSGKKTVDSSGRVYVGKDLSNSRVEFVIARVIEEEEEEGNGGDGGDDA